MNEPQSSEEKGDLFQSTTNENSHYEFNAMLLDERTRRENMITSNCSAVQ